MDLRDTLANLDRAAAGARMHALVARLFPICRSITGAGVRDTLAILGERLPLAIHEVPSGTSVFDWTVPPEWNVRDAWLRPVGGQKVADFRRSNLHLVSYSVPVRATLPLAELRPHLHSLPEHPDWIPYRTSYYKEDWGFCLPHRVLDALPDGDYEVEIDSTLADGHLTYGELELPGESGEEFLFSCHICHPSLANDNLASIAVASELAAALAALGERRYGYRFLFIPGTIGSITWLARNQARLARIRGGLVLANLGDAGGFTYKRSRHGGRQIDHAVDCALRDHGEPCREIPFSPWGYDERQYGSPGIDLAVGRLTRTPHGEYPQYHTSADDLDFVKPAALGGSLAALLRVVTILEGNRRYLNLSPQCEPQLGRRGLYRSLGGGAEGRERELAMLWVLNLSDGDHDLLQIAERSRVSFLRLREAADELLGAGLLRERA